MPLILPIEDQFALKVLPPHWAPALYELINENRSYLRKWLPWVDQAVSPEQTRQNLILSLTDYQRGGGFSLGLIKEAKVIGVLGFHGFDKINRITSLGYWLSATETGNGYMTRAVERACVYAFKIRNMNRILIRAATQNYSSRGIPERLGFIHEGTHRQAEWLYDHFVDLEAYSLLQAEWSKNPHSHPVKGTPLFDKP